MKRSTNAGELSERLEKALAAEQELRNEVTRLWRVAEENERRHAETVASLRARREPDARDLDAIARSLLELSQEAEVLFHAAADGCPPSLVATVIGRLGERLYAHVIELEEAASRDREVRS